MLLQAIWSLLAPPLFLDWDYLHRQEGFSMTIRDCWRRSKYVLFLHHLITLLGNIVLLAELVRILVLLANNPDSRPLSYATVIVIVGIIVSQILVLGLGFLYFKTCHPWARLLKAELSMDTASEASAQRSQICNSENGLSKLSKSEPDLYDRIEAKSHLKRSKSVPELRQGSTKGSVPCTLLVHLVESDNLNPNVTECTHL